MRRFFNRLLIIYTLAPAAASAAEPIIVMRPQIGSGSAGVLPQTAFSSSGGPVTENPSTPEVPDNGEFVFKSSYYIRNRPRADKYLTSTYDVRAKQYPTVGVAISDFPSPLTNCQIDDAADRTRAGHVVDVQFYPTASGVQMFFRPLVPGKMGLTMMCIGEPNGLIYDVELTVK